MSLKISNQVSIPLAQIQLQAIRAQGAGGQNVNKVSSAVHLRFDIEASSLPDSYKESLRKLSDQRITSEGIIILKAQRFRSQEKNREDALDRLRELLRAAGATRKRRKPTKPTRSSQKKRVDSKTKRGQIKSQRARVEV
jgi:ribosome-associated protein